MKCPAPSPERIADLVTRVQAGDEAALHQLYTAHDLSIRFVLSPYRRNLELHDELVIEVYAIFRRLALRYDPTRRAGFTTFLATALPKALKSAARHELREARHTTAISNLQPPGSNDAFTRGVKKVTSN